MPTKEEVEGALKGIIDPELGMNIVDLGLIYDISIEDSIVKISMTLTSPGCPYGPQLLADAEEAVRKIPGVEKVELEVVFDPPWSPEKLSDEMKMELGLL